MLESIRLLSLSEAELGSASSSTTGADLNVKEQEEGLKGGARGLRETCKGCMQAEEEIHRNTGGCNRGKQEICDKQGWKRSYADECTGSETGEIQRGSIHLATQALYLWICAGVSSEWNW